MLVLLQDGAYRKMKAIEPGALSDGTVAGNRGRKRQTIFSSEQFEGIASALQRRVAANPPAGQQAVSIACIASP